MIIRSVSIFWFCLDFVLQIRLSIISLRLIRFSLIFTCIIIILNFSKAWIIHLSLSNLMELHTLALIIRYHRLLLRLKISRITFKKFIFFLILMLPKIALILLLHRILIAFNLILLNTSYLNTIWLRLILRNIVLILIIFRPKRFHFLWLLLILFRTAMIST